jgi:hypothetical protein
MTKISAAAGRGMGMASGRAAPRLKYGFAGNHLLIAAESAQRAHKIEQANLNAQFDQWFDEMARLVPVSIVMSGAALEAFANELIQDLLERQQKESRKQLLFNLKKARRGNALEKLEELALLMDKVPNKKTQNWKSAGLLIEFRNALMHYKPAWDDDPIHSKTAWVVALKGKMPVSRFYGRRFAFPHMG